MPFQSQAQMRAAFSGAIGKEMQGKADQWAHETPDIKHLPDHKGKGAMKGLHKAKPKGKSADAD